MGMNMKNLSGLRCLVGYKTDPERSLTPKHSTHQLRFPTRTPSPTVSWNPSHTLSPPLGKSSRPPLSTRREVATVVTPTALLLEIHLDQLIFCAARLQFIDISPIRGNSSIIILASSISVVLLGSRVSFE
ncbi:hypothetical protein BD779DRAFT_800456 [Infundibulicybe gibba]|nr:hypothetical protein BD779DRAFT_800456 [Infundibulicybe gibba]